jgi:hypothetical protein
MGRCREPSGTWEQVRLGSADLLSVGAASRAALKSASARRTYFYFSRCREPSGTGPARAPLGSRGLLRALTLSGFGDVAVRRETAQERFDRLGTHRGETVPDVAALVEAKGQLNPAEGALFGAERGALDAQELLDPIEELPEANLLVRMGSGIGDRPGPQALLCSVVA